MSIERAIHDRWSTDAALCALLPATRLLTGTAPGNSSLPYAVLSRLDCTPVARTSSGTAVDDARFELVVWAADLELGQRIAAAVARRFERSEFQLGEQRVLLMRRVHHDERREEDGAWRVAVTYLVLHETPDPGITTHV